MFDGPGELYHVRLQIFDTLLVLLDVLKVNDEYSSLVVAQLLFLQSEDHKKPIQMYINSPG